MDSDFNKFQATRYFSSLDGLRCLSILGVIWHHAAIWPAANGGILALGALGVQLFFVISGFLITTLILRERESHGDISLKNFYMRRTLRIFPLYYAVIALYCLVILALEPQSAPGRQFFVNLKYFLSYTTNWFVSLEDNRVIFYFAWSLATEEQFYLVWPSIEKFVRGKGPVLAVLGLLLVSEVVSFGCFQEILPRGSLLRRMLGSVSSAICLGVLLAHALNQPRAFGCLWRLCGPRAAGWLSVAVAAFVAGVIPYGPTTHLLLVFCMAWLVGSCVIREDHWLKPLLACAPLRNVGVVSYGMYLLHMLAGNTAKKLLHRFDIDAPFLKFLLMILIAYGAAWISFHTYEAFFLNLKRKFPAAGPRVRG